MTASSTAEPTTRERELFETKLKGLNVGFPLRGFRRRVLGTSSGFARVDVMPQRARWVENTPPVRRHGAPTPDRLGLVDGPSTQGRASHIALCEMESVGVSDTTTRARSLGDRWAA